MRLTGLSYAYPEVSACDRARILEPRVSAGGAEVFVLATCLRVELAWCGEAETSDVLGQLYGSRDLPPAKMRTDLDAFHHLARVAAGLDSPQVGEIEVLSQFRQASEQLSRRAPAGSDLVTVVKAAVGVARLGRRSLSAPRDGSLASTAALMAGTFPEVVVVGGGAMARAVVTELNHTNVAVYSRRSRPVAGIPSLPWSDLPAALASSRAVVSTVPGPVSVFEDLQRRDGDPLLLVDLGMPPALDDPDPSSVTYVAVDQVASAVPTAAEPEAEETVSTESEKVWRRLTVPRDASSIISSVVELVDQTVDDEVRRFVGRFSNAGEPEQVLRQVAHTVARRIIHPSVSLLGSTPLTPRELEVVARAFGVDRE